VPGGGTIGIISVAGNETSVEIVGSISGEEDGDGEDPCVKEIEEFMMGSGEKTRRCDGRDTDGNLRKKQV
jgi:hypothetical protein